MLVSINKLILCPRAVQHKKEMLVLKILLIFRAWYMATKLTGQETCLKDRVQYVYRISQNILTEVNEVKSKHTEESVTLRSNK